MPTAATDAVPIPPCPPVRPGRIVGPRRPVGPWRSRLVVGLIGVCWLALAARLVQLQWLERSRFRQQAHRQRTFIEPFHARPGDIVDRAGRLLATTVTRQSLYVVPSQVESASELAASLAGVLRLDAGVLETRLEQHRSKHFLWIKRRLSDDETQAVRRLGLPRDLWGFRPEYQRRYPQGRLAAHVLGLRDIDGHGRGGVEQSLDSVLRGRDGVRVLLRDARGRVVEIRDAIAQAPRHGRTVALTIDTIVQLLVEDELDRIVAEWQPQGACVTVLDPATAEILAMASRPALDPNDPRRVSPAAWKNLNLVSMYEPGSTFKPFVVAWALQQGLLRPDEEFDCEQGAWRMGRRVLHDHHPYGVLSLTDVLVKSSNIGMAKIGQRLTNQGLYEATVAFGFGGRTGVELPGELHGLVHPLAKWTSYSTGSIPMGQELAVTPLQLITAHAALANGGTLMKPQIVLRDGDSHPRSGLRTAGSGLPALSITAPRSADSASPSVISRTVSRDIADWLVRGPMAEVVRRGTGRRAYIESAAAFGKTGTAQKFDAATGTYSATAHVCSFIGGAPAADPRVLVLVVVDEPAGGADHTGGSVAAPAGGRILEQVLRTLGEPDVERRSVESR